MRRLFSTILIATATLVSGCGREPSEPKNFSGNWESPQWGVMLMQQNGLTVKGTWEFQNGQLEGTVEGQKLTFRWWQNAGPGEPYEKAPKRDRGDGYFVLAADADGFEGKWKLEREIKWQDNWYAMRVESP